jgi:hypothetical protein
LIVKLHPRCERDELFRSVLAEFPELPSRIVRGGSQEDVLAGAACVLSCGSSAGVEAVLRGVPAIELLPTGSAELLPPDEWGFRGAARDGEQLDPLLDAALAMPIGSIHPSPRVFGNLVHPAAGQIVDSVMAAAAESPADNPERAIGTLRRRTHAGSSSLFGATSKSPIDPAAPIDCPADAARNREEESVPSQRSAVAASPFHERTVSGVAVSRVADDHEGGPA